MHQRFFNRVHFITSSKLYVFKINSRLNNSSFSFPFEFYRLSRLFPERKQKDFPYVMENLEGAYLG